jgi:hypothetical protein
VTDLPWLYYYTSSSTLSAICLPSTAILTQTTAAAKLVDQRLYELSKSSKKSYFHVREILRKLNQGKLTAPALERVREVEGVFRLINRDRSENPTPFDSTGLAG